MRAMRFTLLSILTPLGFVLLAHSADPQPPAQNVIAIIAPGNPWHISLKLDRAGKPVISYSASQSTLFVAHCGNATCTSQNAINKGDHSYALGPTSLALDGAGNPIVAYRFGSDYLGFHQLKMLFCQDPDCSSSSNIRTGFQSASTGVGPSLVFDSAGNPLVSYAAGGSLRVQQCGDPTCSSNNLDTLVGGGVPYTGGLALDAEGSPVVAIASNNSLGVVHCGTSDCATKTITHGLADLGGSDVTAQASLALDASGHPVMSYVYERMMDPTGELHLIHCGDANCSSGNVDSFVDSTFIPPVTSMVLDSRGNPVIAYTKADGNLAIAHCGDAYCASGNTIAEPASLGGWVSLALDARGRPVVAFAASRTLRVLHCATATCQ